MRHFKALTKLELCNFYGLNTFRFSRDQKSKKKSLFLLAGWLLVLSILFFYIGFLSYILILLGLSDVLPAYLAALSSLILFFFDALKAGSVIFRKNGYDMLCSLPIPHTAIVLSRFLRMYLEDLGFTAGTLLPGLAVYVWMLRPGRTFYLLSLLAMLLIPLLPMAAAILIGTLVTAVSSRMKHKSLAMTVLSILAVFAVMAVSSLLSSMGNQITADMLKELSALVLSLLEKIYPPAVWLGMAVVHGDFLRLLLCAAVFAAILMPVLFLVSARFHWISQNLYGTFAKHDYQMGTLSRHSVTSALCRREFRRYFSSSVYVTNTIVGPLVGVICSGILLFTDTDAIFTGLSAVSMHLYNLIPFMLAGIFCTMTTTSTSISMEGKNWWLIKSLPLTTRTILDAKIWMNLLLFLPFYLISELLLILALKPNGLQLIWFLLIPAIVILFSCVYGITVNLHFPVMDWDHEASVVKRSVSAMLGGMGGFILSILCIVAICLIPETYTLFFQVGICVILIGATICLYQLNNRMALEEI